MKRLMALLACAFACGCGALLGVDFDNAQPRTDPGTGPDGSTNVIQCVPKCAGSQVCDHGACADSCSNTAEKSCDGNCVNVATDPNNCIFCGNQCQVPAGLTNEVPVCINGTCSVVCAPNAKQCATGCCLSPGSTTFTPTTATALAAGSAHACVVTAQAQIACWGNNNGGQLGSANAGGAVLSHSNAPVLVPGISSGATAVCAGFRHSCAVVAGGVKCWGDNYWGALGDGKANDYPPGPVDVVHLNDATAIACGYDITCALRSGGTVQCWGTNQWGALGSGSSQGTSSSPVDVKGLQNVKQIAIGGSGSHVCALTSGGEVFCWGLNMERQTGSDSTPPDQADTPARVLGSASFVASGGMESCAVVVGGLQCWGDNRYGQITPDPDAGSDLPPTAVAGVSAPIAVGQGAGQGCALSANQVLCWGRDTEGEQGTGTSSNSDHRLPAAVYQLPAGDVQSLATGGDDSYRGEDGAFTCVLRKNGHVWCWGSNSSGQIGNPAVGTSTAAPIEVQGL